VQTFRRFESGQSEVPAAIAWHLADLEEAREKQKLSRRRSPRTLEALREHALNESALSSNRIEGVTVDLARVETVLFGKSQLRDQNEEEVRGYRKALERIHQGHANERISIGTIQELHRVARASLGDAGTLKTRDSDIIERYADGSVRVRFRPVSAVETPKFTQALVEGWNRCLEEKRVHPLIALGAFSLDFLCIHPFRDGNGRVSRLLLLLQSCQVGYGVGRYISLERLIESNIERYYETLEIGSQGWHHGKHDPWPHIGYLLFILNDAYREFQERIGQE
jgi:Fic family protein